VNTLLIWGGFGIATAKVLAVGPKTKTSKKKKRLGVREIERDRGREKGKASQTWLPVSNL
jgi:hypothetical protein